MSYLTLDADRLVRDAVDAFLAGRLRPDPLPDTVYATKNSRYRIIAGLVHEASDTSLMGAELVGWLVEEPGSARIEPRWRTSSRGVFVERRSGEVVVTSRVITRSVVSETGRRGSAIPPSPPIPQLKQGPSVAPPALVMLGAPDPVPTTRSSRPPMPSDEEVTKVEKTQIADAEEIEGLREISAHSMPPPPPEDGPLPSLPLPDDLEVPTRPVIPMAPATPRDLVRPAFAAPAAVPDARPSPRLVPPRRSSRPPPPAPPSSRRRVAEPPRPSAPRGSAPRPSSPTAASPAALDRDALERPTLEPQTIERPTIEPPTLEPRTIERPRIESKDDARAAASGAAPGGILPPAPGSRRGVPPAPSSRKGAPPPPPKAAHRPLPPPVPPPRRGR